VSNLATVALLSTTLTIALGSEPGWPADRLSDSVLAMIYAGADLAGTLGGSGNGNGNGNIGQ
jgi:hypothetical protein